MITLPVLAISGPHGRGHRIGDGRERLWVLDRRYVARILREDGGPDRAPDDLLAPRLRERRDDDDSLRPERLADLSADQVEHLRIELARREGLGNQAAEE